MEVMVRKYKNIPLWFKMYVEKPFGCIISKHQAKISNKFMEDEKIIYVDGVEFSEQSYNAVPCVGYHESECACCDMEVVRYIKKDSEPGYP